MEQPKMSATTEVRPNSFDQYIGQSRVVSNLKAAVAGARRRGDALDHVLLSGPAGVGKTTLAGCIAAAIGIPITFVNGTT
jgi:holliday junction DNA helicase RuvB